jgi:hypothetical protein
VQLDRLAVTLRLRNPWEAIDLGFAMTRAWMREVYGAWLAVFVPVCALALLVLPPQWATLLVWWLKPALDRVVLHVYANGVFGDLPRVRDTLRALRRSLTPGLAGSLLWYRFFLARSFNLPVWQLERQHGAAARVRRRQLQRRVGSYAVWLTVTCVHFELALGLSLITLYDLLLPAAPDEDFGLFQLLYSSEPLLAQWVFAFAYFAVVSLMEPAYVAAGFALYLNRRTALEGWDLEVALRRIGERTQTAAQPGPAASEADATLMPSAAPLARNASLVATAWLAGLLIAGAVGAAAPRETRAQDTVAPPVTTVAPAQAIKEILARPEFQQYRKRTALEYLGGKGKPEPKPKPRSDWTSWANALDALAQVLRILAWAAVGVALVFLIYAVLRSLGLVGEAVRQEYTPPQTLFGLDVRPESLPADLAAEALRLARAGEAAKALSLLYRGALAALLHRDAVELAGGDTEQDCLRKSRARLAPSTHDYFSRLLRAWQFVAYARRRLPATELETLCAAWPSHFGGTA